MVLVSKVASSFHLTLSLDLIMQRNPASLQLLSKTEQVCICALTISGWEICMQRWCGCQLVHESGSCCSSWISPPRPHIVAFRGAKSSVLHNRNHYRVFFFLPSALARLIRTLASSPGECDACLFGTLLLRLHVGFYVFLVIYTCWQLI